MTRLRIYKTICVLGLLGTVFTPTHTERATALSLSGGGGQLVTVVGNTAPTVITNTLKNTLSEVTSAFMLDRINTLELKEYIKDPLARSIAQEALNQLQAEGIKWINGGFDGSPAFITNLEEYLLGERDKGVGEFIYGSELSSLCEPIEFQVRAALETQYKEEGRGRYTPQCTLDNVPGIDVEAFIDGDFSQGGWAAFFELVVGSSNDPIKAYLDAQINLYDEAARNESLERQKILQADGYKSKEVCSVVEDATGYPRERCEDVTPGALIRDIVSFQVGELPALRLLEIDEFNEVFGALASNLTNQALRGTFGLAGLGGHARYSDNRFGSGSQSYLDALASERSPLTTGGAGDPIRAAIEAEEEYQSMQQGIIDDVDDLERQIVEGEEEYPSCFDLTLADELEDDRDTANENESISILVLQALLELESRLRNVQSAAEQNVVYQLFNELEANGLIRTDYDNQKLKVEFIDFEFKARVDAFQQAIDAEEEQCRRGSSTPTS